MRRYVIRRLLQALPLLVGISIVTFCIIQLAPGDPATLMINPEASLEDVRRLKIALGLDKPVYVQYWRWISRVLRGDLGTSFIDGYPVAAKMLQRIPTTLQLVGLALLVQVSLAIPVGIICATRQYSVFDYAASSFAFLGISLPNFWFGLMLMLLFSVYLGILPSHGLSTYGVGFNLGDRLRHLAMPVLVMGLTGMASFTRYTRSSLLEVVRQDYIRTARAKGLSERVVIYKHALRNSLIPVVTLLGLSLPTLFGGSLIVESLFAIPGMARLAVQAVFQRDYPVIMAVNMMAATMVVAGNLLADIAYALVDPRIKYD
ncbi:MAG: ABC transporter permease [Acetobacteraceae bacterium]|nr:ABC transporter permease [Acetobacteraceae bacterium]